MVSLLSTRLAKRLLRPAATLVDRRINRSTSALRADIKALRAEQYAFNLLFDRTGRSGSRIVTPASIDTLVREIASVTGEDERSARRNVTIAFRNVIALEALAVGRLAGSTSNVCGKLATVPLLAPPNENVLEIGTLYGLFSATLMRMLHRAGIEARLTIVDPLAGSQLQPGAKQASDPTGTPVRMDVVRANLALGGQAGAEARVEKGFSGDPDVQAAVSDRQYGVIIVDGDHSMDGVLADLEWVEKIVAAGGIVVLDDYGDGRWPGVKDALDKHLASGSSRLALLGKVSTSAFLRAS
ncbi:class I SAM-dependent methyltransferase [Streptomyces sp. AK02-01A]|uniref:class I SAM-dependent methyltransferase n=1 Tax=Streptomyces sp. AK02-01A TaxID=3028648 RepID=UPI0029A9CF51|nr:class I SAM-dependent methyltransferase [Streptomyces sp. AK02-01A]MDX3852296.1 class I SAM-dependent methyltransferase [Streptomyces sp. AK02-01A]